MLKLSKLALLLVVILFIVPALACGGSDQSGEKIGENPVQEEAQSNQPNNEIASEEDENNNHTDQEVQEPQKTEELPSQFTVGDIVQVKDHTITLVAIDLKNNIVKATFVIIDIHKNLLR